MKKVVILGAKGMLGYAATKYFRAKAEDVCALSRNEFDIAKDPIAKLKEYVTGADLVLNAAGVIKPQIATMSIEDVLRVNAVFPHNLAKLCISMNVPCVHVTTDCVYSGKTGNYNELDFFDADDVYGMSKNAGESKDIMTIRTSIIGEEHGQKRSLLEWVRGNAGKEINGFTNHRWNGLTTWYLADIVYRIIQNGAYKPGLWHVHSPDTLSKFELVSVINTAYELGIAIRPVEASERCDRNISSIYPLTAEYSVLTIKEQVEKMREFFSTGIKG
ncbi:MAG: sugar nucleotide-binding protein [Ignavibacteriales bacterium]|nr:sugar nucleotide-binding protein [Ignavibacteriales bacterium]